MCMHMCMHMYIVFTFSDLWIVSGSVRRLALGRIGRSGRPEVALRPGPAGAGRSLGAFRAHFF